MYMSECNWNKSVTRVIADSAKMGDNSSIYMDKISSKLSRDRMAFSLIVGALESQTKFTSTLLRFRDIETEQIREYQSSMPLTYEAAMAFTYLKRLEGELLVDIAYICEDSVDGSSFISLEGLNCDSDILKLSLSDQLIPLVDALVESDEHREMERHKTSVTTLVNTRGSSLKFQDALELGFSKTFGIQGRCEIKSLSSIGKAYKIVYADSIGGVIRGNRLTVATLDYGEYADELKNNIKRYTDTDIENIQISCTDSIIMF